MGNNFFAIACVPAGGRPRVPAGVNRALFGTCKVDSLTPGAGSLSRSTNQVSSGQVLGHQIDLPEAVRFLPLSRSSSFRELSPL